MPRRHGLHGLGCKRSNIASGIVGLGQMGLPMCARLVERGFAVTATDVVAERKPEAVTAGARWAGSAAEVAAEVGVVITVLPGLQLARLPSTPDSTREFWPVARISLRCQAAASP
ncbi:MAG: NAD(P)-binding domain-containing protein [Steroidobacteraceae bacterium]